jgi:hypothetical protein
LVGLLFFGGVSEGDTESVFELGPEDFVCLGYVAWWEKFGF